VESDFDPYVRRNTWIHHLDPRVKLAFVLEATVLAFLWPSVWMEVGTVLVCLVLLWQAQIPAKQVARVWRLMLPLMAMVFLLTALFGGGSGTVLLRLGPVTVTAGAVLRGAVLAIRLLALALIIFLWLFTTDQASMVRGFVALRMPYEWGLTLALALRYLPIFAGLFEQVREAQQARGLDLEQRSFWARLRAYHPVLVAMVIGALRNSERLGWALEARAFGAQGVRRSVFHPLHLRRSDLAALAALAALGACLLAAIALRIA